MEWIIPMTAGLLLDMCGTLLILKPFMVLSKKARFSDYTSVLATFEIVGPDWYQYIEELDKKVSSNKLDEIKKNKDYSDDVKWGFAFFIIGFNLILIASLINYYQ